MPTNHQPNEEEPLVLSHDIGNGVKIDPSSVPPQLVEQLNDASSSLTLRLTNEKGLTTMPCITELPSFVTRLEFDATCSSLTNIEVLKPKKTRRKNPES